MVAGVLGDPRWIIVAWLAGAAFSFVGALCYARLARPCFACGRRLPFPDAGIRARHRCFSMRGRVPSSSTRAPIALLAFVFGDYLSTIVTLATRTPPRSGRRWSVIAHDRHQCRGVAEVEVCACNVLTAIGSPALVAVVIAGSIGGTRAAAGAETLYDHAVAGPSSARRWCSSCSPTADGTKARTFPRSKSRGAIVGALFARHRHRRNLLSRAVNGALLSALRGRRVGGQWGARRRRDGPGLRSLGRACAGAVRRRRDAGVDQRATIDRRRPQQLRDGARLDGPADARHVRTACARRTAGAAICSKVRSRCR